MYYVAHRIPSPNPNYKNGSSAIQQVHQVSDRDGEMLSPVDLSIRDASTIQLPLLSWAHYNLTPTSIIVKNTGFTVMINALFDQEPPFVTAGPLLGNYVFFQIHFHWGKHDETGSAHAIDGVRYPLEMHVVHIKKDCANLGEALKSKDGIAVMVHLFAVREERNTQLDQLTAILQFIRRPKCCARLYPTPISEMVYPFTSDYYLYWGAVGSPKGQYRIMWLVSRNVLPVSTYQLEEFRRLYDPQGKLLLTNTSKPQPLAGRSLFLVSPSERSENTMYGISRRATQRIVTQDSLDIGNAEYRSLAALDEFELDQCRICPPPSCLEHIANINVDYPYKVNEGDTSVEESCIDLDTERDSSGLTVKTEMRYKGNTKRPKLITNVNVTSCRHKCRVNRPPSETVYSVISARGSELHLRRKPMTVRQTDPSTEQACMFLNPMHITHSAPSLSSTVGLLTKKEECTNLPRVKDDNVSSEIAVCNRDSMTPESGMKSTDITPRNEISPEVLHSSVDEYLYESTLEESFKSSKKSKKVTIQEFEDTDSVSISKTTEKKYVSEDQTQKVNKIKGLTAQNHDTNVRNNNIDLSSVNHEEYLKEREEDVLHEQTKNKYYLVKQINNKQPFYKVIDEFSADFHPRKFVATGKENLNDNNMKNIIQSQIFYGEGASNVRDNSNMNKPANQQAVGNKKASAYPGVYDPNKQSYKEYYKESSQKEKYDRQVFIKSQIPIATNNKPGPNDGIKLNKQPQTTKNKNIEDSNLKTHQETDPESHYRVSLVVRTTVSDHRKPGKRKNEGGQKYVVTKISPAEKPVFVSPRNSSSSLGGCREKQDLADYNNHLYYARRINDDQTPEKDSQSLAKINKPSYTEGQNFTSEFYESSLEETHTKHTEGKHLTITTTQNDFEPSNKPQDEKPVKNNPTQIISPPVLHRNSIQKKQNTHSNELFEDEQVDSYHEKVKKDKLQQIQIQKSQAFMNLDSHKHTVNSENYNVDRSTGNVTSITHLDDTKLLHKINTYQGKNDENDNIRITDETVTGKIGKTQSVDIFVKGTLTQVENPQKTDLTKEINYNLVRSKHPEPQVYVKEPSDKSHPPIVIHQKLSLDQQVTGYSHIRQTVEFQGEKPKTTDTIPNKQPEPEIMPNTHVVQNKKNVTQTYEAVNQEESLKIKKTQQQSNRHFQSTFQNERDDLSYKNQVAKNSVHLKKESENDTVQQEYTKKSMTSSVDPNSTVSVKLVSKPKELSQEESSKPIGNSSLTQSHVSHISVTSNQNKLINSQAIKESGYASDPRGSQVTSYEYEDSQFVREHLEKSRQEKRIYYNQDVPVRSIENVDPNEKLQKGVPEKQPIQETIQYKPSAVRQRGVGQEEIITSSTKEHVEHKLHEKKITFKQEIKTNVEEQVDINRKHSPPKQLIEEMTGNRLTGYKEHASELEKECSVDDRHEIQITERNKNVNRVTENTGDIEKHDSEEIEIQETTEENIAYSSQKSREKKTTTQMKDDIYYKIPIETHTGVGKQSSQYSITIKKVEIPEPHYITRVPKQPVIEYEAFPVDPHHPFQIITETSEEISSIIKTNKTFMMFKKINGKAVLNQPSIIEPIKIERKRTQDINQQSEQSIKTNLSSYSYRKGTLIKSGPQEIASKEKTIHEVREEEHTLNQRKQNLRSKTAVIESKKYVEEERKKNAGIETKRTQIPVYINQRSDQSIKTNKSGYSYKKAHLVKPDPKELASKEQIIYEAKEEESTVNERKQFLKSKTTAIESNQYFEEESNKITSLENVKETNIAVVKTDEKNADLVPIVSEKQHNQPITIPEKHGALITAYEESLTSVTSERRYTQKERKYKYSTNENILYEQDELKPTTGDNKTSRELKYFNTESKTIKDTQQYTIEPDATEKRSSLEKRKHSTGETDTSHMSKNLPSRTVPINKHDGDIVIYIRQPNIKKEGHPSPKITVDLTKSVSMTSSELLQQNIHVKETKKESKKENIAKKPVFSRKSKSEHNTRSQKSTDESRYELENNLSSDSNEEQIIDTTHYNLTLKSQTEADLPVGQNAHVVSKAQVTITPVSRPDTPSKFKSVYGPVTTVDECCSAIRIDELDEDLNSTGCGSLDISLDQSGFNLSPIKIDTQSTETRNYPEIQFINHWDAQGQGLLENNGKTLRATYLEDTALPYLQGGPFQSEYIFSELHFHWGRKDCCGAEHIVDGERYTLEAHFLYFKKEYGSVKEAINHLNGLAIIAVFFTVGGPPHPLFGELIADLHLLREANTGSYVPTRTFFSWIKQTIDKAEGYYSYKGSMTSQPPHVESVTWIIFPKPIVFCCQQSCEFRKLKSLEGELLRKNYRSPQPRNNRPIYYVPT